MTALGTSIDAMAVGVSLAFLEADIATVIIAIAGMTFLMSTGGALAARWIGRQLGRWAEQLGGLALIGLGGAILPAHLGG